MRATLLRSTTAELALAEVSCVRPRVTVVEISPPRFERVTVKRSPGRTVLQASVCGIELGPAIEGSNYQLQRQVASVVLSDGSEHWFLHPAVPVKGKPFKLGDFHSHYQMSVTGWTVNPRGAVKLREGTCHLPTYRPNLTALSTQVVYSEKPPDDSWHPLHPAEPLAWDFPFEFTQHPDTGDPIVSNGRIWLLRYRPSDFDYCRHTLDKLSTLGREALKAKKTRESYFAFVNSLRGLYVQPALSFREFVSRSLSQHSAGEPQSGGPRNRITDVFDDFGEFDHERVLLPGTCTIATRISRGEISLWVLSEPDTAVYVFDSEQDAVDWVTRRKDAHGAREQAVYFTIRSGSWQQRVRNGILSQLQNASN